MARPILIDRGLKRKLELGGWFRPLLQTLIPLRRVRGTRWDPFASKQGSPSCPAPASTVERAEPTPGAQLHTVEQLRAAIVDSGAARAAEVEISQLEDQALAALRAMPVPAEAGRELEQLTELLIRRSS